MIKQIYQAKKLADRHAFALFAGGLVVVAWHNWRLWQRDKALFSERKELEYLPLLESWPALPKVSILVAAWNEAEHIEQHIQSFLSLQYPHKELVLCAGGEDGTFELAGQFSSASVTVLEQRLGEGKQRALHHSLTYSEGSIIFLTDADCELNNEMFERVLYPIITGHAQVVTGTSVPKHSQRRHILVEYQWLLDLEWSLRMPKIVSGLLGRNCAMQRTILDKIGAFETQVYTGTDYFMSRRLEQEGYPIHSVPNSQVVSDYPTTMQHYLQMWRRWNKNLLIHGLRFKAWVDVKGIIYPLPVYSFMLLSPILTLLCGPIVLSISMTLYIFAVCNRLRRALIGAQQEAHSISWILLPGILIFTLLDMVAVVLAAIDSVHPSLRIRW